MPHTVAIIVAGSCLTAGALGQSVPADAVSLRDDAAWRTSRLADEGGGWDKGRFFITDGGANRLNIGGFMQFRFLSNWRDEGTTPDPADFTQGFQMRRARLSLSGTVWSKDLSFTLLTDASRSSGAVGFLDAFGEYAITDDVSVRWGQFKLPYNREELVNDNRQLAIERSTVNSVFGYTRTQGVMVSYTTDSFRLFGMVSDGGNALNNDFTSAAEADIAFTARADFRWGEGDSKRFEDLTSWRESGVGALLGGAVHVQTGGETGGTADVDLYSATVDFSLEGDGWNLFAAAHWLRTEPASGAETDDFGLLLQGGVFVTDQVEPFVRYDAIIADDANGEDFHTITAGVNYYVSPRSHAFKLSADVQYYLDAEGENALVSPTTGSNLLADPDDGQVAVRVQAQIIF
ncbi:MAG: porin [Planctomycetota bacterium]|nr:porin [Planctomycetota bacterium]